MSDKTQMIPALTGLFACNLATTLLATITHYLFFGYNAIAGGIIMMLLFGTLYWLYRKTANKLYFLFFILLTLFIIIGFGLVDGFWNHTIKVAIFYLHGGYIPPLFTALFSNAQIGSFFEETVGILTFVFAMGSLNYALKLLIKNKSS